MFPSAAELANHALLSVQPAVCWGACKTPTDAACSQATQLASAQRGRNVAHRGEPVVEKAKEHGNRLRPGDETRQAGGV